MTVAVGSLPSTSSDAARCQSRLLPRTHLVWCTVAGRSIVNLRGWYPSEPEDWRSHRHSSPSRTYKASTHSVRRLGESLASASGLRRANGRTLAKGLLEDTDRFGNVLNLDDVWWQKTQDVAGRAIDQ